MVPHRVVPFALVALGTAGAVPLGAQSPASADSVRPAILAVVDSALSAITAGDFRGFADLMLPEAQIYSARTRDGLVVYRMRTAAGERTTASATAFVERGFDADIRVSGPVAVVWLPYDIYAGGEWSHCGVDVFTVVRVQSSWRIANLTYSIEQPPACRPHPKGPPPGMKVPGAAATAVSGLASPTASVAQEARRYFFPRTAADTTGGPFSGAVLVGNTLYLSGRLGLTDDRKVPDSVAEEARRVLDDIRMTLVAAGMTMDDLVFVQVFCSDVAHFDAFNRVYRTYFTKEFPARAFLGSGTLLFGARFEVQGIAVRR